MEEIVKRLTPVKKVLRGLYLKSGNQCAYPECHHQMIESKGNFVGQICHIEAAEKGGERFNPNQTNEERRAFSNLMLMCYKHHVETDGVKSYPVSRLQKMKLNHESKFTDIAEIIHKSIVDHTELSEISFAQSLKKINKLLKWNNSEDELAEIIDELNEFSERLKKLPITSREFLVIITKRAQKRSGVGLGGLELSTHELEHVTGEETRQLREHFQILDISGFTREGFEDDFGLSTVELCALSSGWPIFEDFLKFCEIEQIELSEILVDLQFCLLD